MQNNIPLQSCPALQESKENISPQQEERGCVRTKTAFKEIPEVYREY